VVAIVAAAVVATFPVAAGAIAAAATADDNDDRSHWTRRGGAYLDFKVCATSFFWLLTCGF